MNTPRLPYHTVIATGCTSCDHTLEIAQAVENAVRSSRETIERLTIEKDALADEVTRLRTERARGRQRLIDDLRKPETLVDAAALSLARMSVARDLPGHERHDWFDDAVRRGCTDIGAI